ncbi:MAG TPA: hypothetical protein VF808_17195 [Ktedonobacterales bacterium]
MSNWDYDQSKSLLSPENLGRVRAALKTGPVFGYWYRAHSGGGPNYWIALEYEDFERTISRGRPADYYVVWSLPALVAQGMALAEARFDDLPLDPRALFSREDLRAIEAHLSDPSREVFALFLGTARGAEAWTTDQEGLDSIAEHAEWYCRPGGEGYVFPFTSSQDRDASGLLMDTVERPEYWLFEAWYPDEWGHAPVEIA